MKKVLFINTNPFWGGGEKWHFEMAKAVKQRGYEVAILGFAKGDLEERCSDIQFPFFPIKINNFSFISPFKRMKARRILQKFKPDSIILNLPRDVKLFAPLASEMQNINVIHAVNK